MLFVAPDSKQLLSKLSNVHTYTLTLILNYICDGENYVN